VGAVSVDLMLALIVTSLLRARIGRRTWRAVHWLAYLSWPVAFAHSIGSGTDLRHGWMLDLGLACAAAVAAAVAWRVRRTLREATRAQRPALILAAAAGPAGLPAPAAAAGPGGESQRHAEAGAR
jgi:DMSO/TMAO reductase YedYZ heme-binding membrane subunit